MSRPWLPGRRARIRRGRLLFVLGALVMSPSGGLPQGLSGAAVSGTVRTETGEPVARAQLFLRNANTGYVRERQVDTTGRFLFDEVPPGGPYWIEARALGFVPSRGDSALMLALGERVVLALVLQTTPTSLSTVAVRSVARSNVGGASFSLDDEMVHGLPLRNRDFVGLFATIPQAAGRTTLSVSGQTPSLNAIQVDGGIGSDVYGVGGRTPGAAAGARSLSLEALDQIQVLVAPFDIRQGAFTGALINGITRSGSNRWQGTVFTSVQDNTLVGRDALGARAERFDFVQYGATFGGPLVRDRLHVFLVADLQRSRTPFVGPETSDPATGISDSTARRVAAAFVERYGINAGGPEAPALYEPNKSLFAKLSWQPSPQHHVDLSYNWIDGRTDEISRPVRGWELSNSSGAVATAVHTARVRIASAMGRFTNELMAGVQTTDDDRTSSLRTPRFLIQADAPASYVAGGSHFNAATILDQRLIEVTDNVTLLVGSHELTAGIHGERYHFKDDLFQTSWGVWTFRSVADFEQKRPSQYEVAIPLRDGGPIADFSADQLAVYAQDRWTPVERFTVTAGLRVERGRADVPVRNPLLAASAELGELYASTFSRATQLSPRVGISWRPLDRSALTVRAGAGVFTGRPPLVWLGNAFTNTGLDQARVTCSGSGVPAPVTNVDDVPQECLAATRTVPAISATHVNGAFRFPQVVKTLVGLDLNPGGGTSVSVDAVRTASRHQPYVRDANLWLVGTSSEGRALYGTLGKGTLVPARRDTTFSQVYEIESRGGDRDLALSVTGTKRWANGSVALVGYQWSQSTSAMTRFNPGASLAFQNSPIDGTIDDRRQAASGVDVPHRLVASVLGHLPYAIDGSLVFRAQSGRPYAFVATNDANGDGTIANDLFYVPRNASDISLSDTAGYAGLDAFIESQACLREQRGRIMARNSCRNPATVTLDARLAKTIGARSGRGLELGLDVFNLLNLLNDDWGLVREATNLEPSRLLTVDGWDGAANRPRYKMPSAFPGRLPVLDASRWRVQLGARYRLW